MRILCVDDEPDILSLMTEYLELFGHRVVGAANGRQAMDIFSQDPGAFDVLISDVKMPQMSGLELLRKIREQGFTVPIILVSGHNDKTLLESMDQSEISAVIAKPFTLSSIQGVLENL